MNKQEQTSGRASGARVEVSGLSGRGERRTWYFTFGVGQPNAGRYFVVRDATSDEARARMVHAFGREWGFQYDESEWVRDGVSQAEQYGLTEIR